MNPIMIEKTIRNKRLTANGFIPASANSLYSLLFPLFLIPINSKKALHHENKNRISSHPYLLPAYSML